MTSISLFCAAIVASCGATFDSVFSPLGLRLTHPERYFRVVTHAVSETALLATTPCPDLLETFKLNPLASERRAGITSSSPARCSIDPIEETQELPLPRTLGGEHLQRSVRKPERPAGCLRSSRRGTRHR